MPDRRALIVPSPFDYATQGDLRILGVKHSPKSAEFSDELCEKPPDLLRGHRHGQLVLFTSRRQMQACRAALLAIGYWVSWLIKNFLAV